MKTPDTIYLQTCVGCEETACHNCDFDSLDMVTWSKDQIEKSDAVYFSEQAVREALMKAYTHANLLAGDPQVGAERHARIRVENVISKMKGGQR